MPPTTLIINAGPPPTVKQSICAACCSFISFRSYKVAIPLAPVGYPPMKLINIVAAVQPGRLKRDFVILFKGELSFADSPDCTANDAKNIKGNSEGIRILAEKSRP